MPDVRGTRAMLNRAYGLYGNIPKMNTKKQRLCARKRGKTLSQVPSRSFFPPEKELLEKNRNNFSFRFFASLFCAHHDSFFTKKHIPARYPAHFHKKLCYSNKVNQLFFYFASFSFDISILQIKLIY